jgi:hypothetical protein
MIQPSLVQTPAQQVEEAIARWRRLVVGGPLQSAPSTVQSEIYQMILQDNATLITEVARLRQENLEMKMQRRLEITRELELQFPRKRRRR